MTNIKLEGKVEGSKMKSFEERKGIAKPKSEPKIGLVKQPALCDWYVIFGETPEEMNRETMDIFIQRYGCEGCNGYRTPCEGRRD